MADLGKPSVPSGVNNTPVHWGTHSRGVGAHGAGEHTDPADRGRQRGGRGASEPERIEPGDVGGHRASGLKNSEQGDWMPRARGWEHLYLGAVGCAELGLWSPPIRGLGCAELGHGEAGGLSHLLRGEQKAAGASPMERGKMWLFIYPHQLPRGISYLMLCSLENAPGD